MMQPRDKTELALQISKMRERMIQANSQSTDALYDIKLDSGGMVDIEFLSQFLVLLQVRQANLQSFNRALRWTFLNVPQTSD
ncbi:MAG: hypothetical protein ACNYPI_08055 [Arenicellales bacterium WSBS_2016_MAG_OTU3]